MPFNQEKANRCTEFIQTLKLGDDFKGQRFYLLEWQRKALEEFYGTVKENGYRQYHYLYLEMPKKNGKTQLAAGLGVYHLTADGATDGEIYICAADKANASIAFNAAVSMISQSKYLTKRLKIKASTKEIYDPATNSKMKVLSADAYSKHGYKPTCVIFDELHAQPTRDLWDVMTFGSGSARKQPVYIVLTTAGDDPDHKSIGWEIHEKARKIKEAREGNKEYEDIPTWLPIIYGLGGDPEEISKVDIYDEEVWYRCNPSLGHTISIETLREEARDAKSSPGAERLFRWLRLNQWISVKNVGWLPLTEYDDTELIIDESELLHCPCWGGVDLSSTTDLTCITLTFPPYKKRNFFYQLYFPYITAEKMRERQQRDHVPFEDWVQDGYVLTTGSGINPVDVLKDTLTYDKEIERYSLSQLHRGLKPNIVITVEGQGNDKTYDEYDKVVKRFKENGVLYISPDQTVTDLKDACVIDPKVAEVKQITVKKVASVFNIPAYKIWDGSSSYSSAEEADLEYLKDTILPTIRLYEQEFSKALLTRSERMAGYEIKFSMNGFARGNMNTRSDFYQKMIRNGAISPNEIRELEDMPPYQGGDEYYLSRDMISVSDLRALNQKELSLGGNNNG